MQLKIHKSAGVPVTAPVRRLIREGDTARDAKDWKRAAEAYAAALVEDPALGHIWVQLGHAQKEGGDPDAAATAYGRAAALDPKDAEAALHLGHLRKLAGDSAGAAGLYLDAFRRDPSHPDALTEVHRSIERDVGLSKTDLLALLRRAPDPEEAGDAPIAGKLDAARDALDALVESLRGRSEDADTMDALAAASALIARLEGDALAKAGKPATGPAIVFDASDLIGYFRHSRLPTGIQRVQIETIANALRGAVAGEIRICCFTEARDAWLEVPPGLFKTLARLSLLDGDRADAEWMGAISRLYLGLAAQTPFEFPRDAFLINLGTSWALQNYFLYVRDAKRRFNIRYVPFVHDLIPVMAPEFCIRELTQDFISWALGVFDHADFFLTNSQATKRDLIAVAEQLGHQIEDGAVAVIPLDADIRKPHGAALGAEALSRWGLEREPFVLFVSTIEARKNHAAAFDAWSRLMREHGARRIPRLVCVGHRGWLNDAIYARLAHDDQLRGRVTMLSHISDDELDLLYRSCLFTLYPSHYEGWGLPVTESLCHGKVPVISDASSLPEAGGPFGVYFEAGSVEQLTQALTTMIFDAGFRRAAEARIQADFRPRTWDQVVAQIEGEVRRRADDPSPRAVRPAKARLGVYHPIVRNIQTRIWRGLGLGEIYRAGTGWWWPDDWGCWTKPQGGEIAIGLAGGTGTVRAYLRLQGLPSAAVRYELADTEGVALATGKLAPGEGRWIVVEAPGGHDLRFSLHGSESQSLEQVSGGLDLRRVSVGLSGFFLCEAGDLKARQDLLEAVSFGDLEPISAYREHEAGAAQSRQPRLLDAAQ